MASTSSSPTIDTSRISISAHYTGFVWYKHRLSAPEFVTPTGRFANALLTPVNAFLRLAGGADIDTFLLQRHKVIDHLVETLVKEQGVEQIVELAAGLSPRGYRLKKAYPHVHYIETDLPGMALRKQQLLSRVDKQDRHDVHPCNILQHNGEQSISALLDTLDRKKSTVIISEGLVNYFELAVIKTVWHRIACALGNFPAGYYITDLYPDLVEHPSYKYAKGIQKMVGLLTKGEWPLHYSDNGAIKKGFLDDGFSEVNVHDPSEFYETVQLPLSNTQSMVRLIQAQA